MVSSLLRGSPGARFMSPSRFSTKTYPLGPVPSLESGDMVNVFFFASPDIAAKKTPFSSRKEGPVPLTPELPNPDEDSAPQSVLLCKVIGVKRGSGEVLLRTPKAHILLVREPREAFLCDRQLETPQVFEPGESWREIPRGAIVRESGVEYKMDLEKGLRMARKSTVNPKEEEEI